MEEIKKIENDPVYLQGYEAGVAEERRRVAQAIFDFYEEEMTGIEELDKECPEDEPVEYCVHDVRCITFNVLYEVMHKKLGFHIQRGKDGRDCMVEGPLHPSKGEQV